ncbi:MAG: hypothetical protein AAF125_15125 [Chloroflexota bacterium]
MDLITLANQIIDMRKHPLKHNGGRDYPTAAAAFTAGVEACEDADVLREIIQIDTGHVLPTVAKQRTYEKLLEVEGQRSAALLDAFAMHLLMFGYVDAMGMRQPDTDARIDALLAEADAKRD